MNEGILLMGQLPNPLWSSIMFLIYALIISGIGILAQWSAKSSQLPS